MLSVPEAVSVILDCARPFPSRDVPLDEAVGCVLREEIVADRDLPPFDRSTMDGIALAYAAFAGGRRDFTIESVQPAGRPAQQLRDPSGSCIEIMTGAMLPRGADTVIPVELVTKEGRRATLRSEAHVASGQYIHRQGDDRKAGGLLLSPGCRLHAPQVAILASTGRTHVIVSTTPRVAIVSVGDELVDPGQPIEVFQIRTSNAYGLQSALQAMGCRAIELSHLRDDPAQIAKGLRDLVARNDVIILSGGVSKGLFDFVPRTLAELGVREVFHRVSQKPGQPMWFGTRADGWPVFALPGNPVSTLVCFHRLVRPWFLRSMGSALPDPVTVRLASTFRLNRPLTHFLPIRIDTSDPGGLPTARLLTYHGSGDYASLGDSDGYVELPPDHDVYDAGAVVRYYGWST